MTFLCGPDALADVPHGEYSPGKWGWPQPWQLRCDGCGHVFAYAAIGRGAIAQTGPDEHHCTPCQQGRRTGQLALDLAGTVP